MSFNPDYFDPYAVDDYLRGSRAYDPDYFDPEMARALGGAASSYPLENPPLHPEQQRMELAARMRDEDLARAGHPPVPDPSIDSDPLARTVAWLQSPEGRAEISRRADRLGELVDWMDSPEGKAEIKREADRLGEFIELLDADR